MSYMQFSPQSSSSLRRPACSAMYICIVVSMAVDRYPPKSGSTSKVPQIRHCRLRIPGHSKTYSWPCHAWLVPPFLPSGPARFLLREPLWAVIRPPCPGPTSWSMGVWSISRLACALYIFVDLRKGHKVNSSLANLQSRPKGQRSPRGWWRCL